MRPLQVLTPRGISLMGVGLCTVLAGIFAGYPDITRVGVLLFVLPTLALVVAGRRAPELAVSRSVTPLRLHPDEPGQVRSTLTNVGTRRTPLYLAQEQVSVHLGDRPRFVLRPLERGEIRTIKYQVRSSHRGVYRLGPLSLRQRDPFGLTYVAVRLSSTTEVVVLPRVYQLSGQRSVPQGRGSEGERPQMIALHGEDDVSIRHYRQGDELRRVHWPATAHRGDLMVRQEDRPARRRAVLLLDSRSAAHGGAPAASATFEYAISALASVGRALLMDGYVVHLLSTHTISNGAAAHPMDLDTLLDTLARAERADNAALEAVASAAHAFTSGGILAVAAIVAHDAEDIRHLATVREHGSTAVAFVLDRLAFNTDPAPPPTHPSRPPPPSRVLGEAGWATVVCTSHTNIESAWGQLQNRPAVGLRS